MTPSHSHDPNRQRIAVGLLGKPEEEGSAKRAPPAPYPAQTAAHGFPLRLDVEAAVNLDSWALASAEGRPLMLMLWLKAWQQVPCGSIPDDDTLIARLIDVRASVFASNRAVLMRDWWRADDGRLYCDFLVKHANEMIYRRAHGWRKHLPDVLDRCGERCWYCGRTDLPLSLDHIVARSCGGTDDPENLVPACRPCNSSKGATPVTQWLLKRGRQDVRT